MNPKITYTIRKPRTLCVEVDSETEFYDSHKKFKKQHFTKNIINSIDKTYTNLFLSYLDTIITKFLEFEYNYTVTDVKYILQDYLYDNVNIMLAYNPDNMKKLYNTILNPNLDMFAVLVLKGLMKSEF